VTRCACTAAHELDGSSLYWAHRNKSKLGKQAVDLSATKGLGTTAEPYGESDLPRAQSAGALGHQSLNAPPSGSQGSGARAAKQLSKTAKSSVAVRKEQPSKRRARSSSGRKDTVDAHNTSNRARRSLFQKPKDEPRLSAKSMVASNSSVDPNDPTYSGGQFWGRPAVKSAQPVGEWTADATRPVFEPMSIPKRRVSSDVMREGSPASPSDQPGQQPRGHVPVDSHTPFQLMTKEQQRAFLARSARQHNAHASRPRQGNQERPLGQGVATTAVATRQHAPTTRETGVAMSTAQRPASDSDEYASEDFEDARESAGPAHSSMPKQPLVATTGSRGDALLKAVSPAGTKRSKKKKRRKKKGLPVDNEDGVPNAVMTAFKELMHGSAALFEATMSKVGHERATELEQAKIDHEAAEARWQREREETAAAHQADRENTILHLNEQHEQEMEGLRELMRKELAKSMRERRAALETQQMRHNEETARRAFERDELLKKQVEEADSRVARLKAAHERQVRLLLCAYPHGNVDISHHVSRKPDA